MRPAGLLIVEVAHLGVEVPRHAGPLRRDALEVPLLGAERELAEQMRLIDEREVHAHLLERHGLVLPAGALVGQLLLQFLLHVLYAANRVAIALLIQAGQRLLQHVELFLDQMALELVAHRDLGEAGMGDDDGVEVVLRHVGDELLAPRGMEPLLVGHGNPRGRILLVELLGELPQHVIGHDVDRLPRQPEPAHFHAGTDHGGGFAGADRVRHVGVAVLHDARHHAKLVCSP